MVDSQKGETLGYFRSSASDWARKSKGEIPHRVNVVKQRNQVVLDVLEARDRTAQALDVGCGTGDLVCEIAARGTRAVGVDFASEMIDLAEARAEQGGIDTASFACASIFDYPLEPSSFDLISGNGFIEYISPIELDRFLGLAFAALSPGGSLVLGSRNRLFNLYSLNGFTRQEAEAGNIEALMSESLALQDATGVDDLRQTSVVPRQPEDIRLGNTGIDVSTRYQFTPSQLADLVRQSGFLPRALVPIHIHGVTPAFKAAHPDIHVEVAEFLQRVASNDVRLLAQASSFMIHAQKPSE